TSGERQDANEDDSSEEGTASHCPLGLFLRGRRSLLAEATNVVDDLPDLRRRQRPLHGFHLGHRRGRAVENQRVDLAIARAMVPLGVGQIRWLGGARRQRALTLA